MKNNVTFVLDGNLYFRYLLPVSGFVVVVGLLCRPGCPQIQEIPPVSASQVLPPYWLTCPFQRIVNSLRRKTLSFPVLFCFFSGHIVQCLHKTVVSVVSPSYTAVTNSTMKQQCARMISDSQALISTGATFPEKVALIGE